MSLLAADLCVHMCVRAVCVYVQFCFPDAVLLYCVTTLKRIDFSESQEDFCEQACIHCGLAVLVRVVRNIDIDIYVCVIHKYAFTWLNEAVS